jgi:hypothetical protein
LQEVAKIERNGSAHLASSRGKRELVKARLLMKASAGIQMVQGEAMPPCRSHSKQ